MKMIVGALGALLISCLLSAQVSAPSVPSPSTSPDPRFKADLLVVVAHPDDESEIGAFLARAAFDEHKRIALVYGTRGNSGGNAIGEEQAAALGDIREIEGRRAMAYLGISDVWFLDAPDTPGQDVLRSLETWNHGRALESLVRIVRLTRPSVIATWLPAYSAGENHGDHQAAGVLATEAFDSAGDPTQFPEQVTPPRDPRDISNLTEGLHPWQAEKLYYFSDASHFDFMEGQGPEYSARAISPAKKKSYARLAAEECSFHLTQSDSGYAAAKALEKNDLTNTYFDQPSRFVFGKSHVDATTKGDIFDGVKERPVHYVPAPGYKASTPSGPTVELGGPWHFYSEFWIAHGLDHLSTLLPPEVEAGVSTRVSLPILITNPDAESLESEIGVTLPSGWSLAAGAGKIEVGAGETAASRVIAVAPASVDAAWKHIVVRASANGKPIGEVKVRVHVVQWSLPQ